MIKIEYIYIYIYIYKCDTKIRKLNLDPVYHVLYCIFIVFLYSLYIVFFIPDFKSCVLPYTYSVYDAITSDHYRAGGTAGVAPGSAA